MAVNKMKLPLVDISLVGSDSPICASFSREVQKLLLLDLVILCFESPRNAVYIPMGFLIFKHWWDLFLHKQVSRR